MDSNQIKVNFLENPTATGVFGSSFYDISTESKVRIVVIGAGPTNTIEVKGRIKLQNSWTLIKTLTGNGSTVVDVSTFDEMQLEIMTYDASPSVRVVCSSFDASEGGGLSSISVPAGDNLTEIDSLILTSSDGSVIITGDDVTKTIDLILSPISSPIKYSLNFFVINWALNGDYEITVSAATHGKGVNPTVEVYEVNGPNYDLVSIFTEVDASGNVTIIVPSTPDLRFIGKLTIE